MRRATSTMAAPLALLALTPLFSCEVGFPAGAEPHRELNRIDMADQPKLKPQRSSLYNTKTPGMLEPPAGAIAVDSHPYIYTQEQGELAGKENKNPLQATPQVLTHGQFIFENMCVTCHGPQAAGDGHITRLFPVPPSLMTQKIRDWSDGRIFHLPMRGQGSMPSHSKQLEARDIWAVVLYLRQLQAKLPVAPAAKTDSATQGGL